MESDVQLSRAMRCIRSCSNGAVYGLLLSSLCAANVFAQTLPARPTVTRAVDLFDSPQSRVAVGTQLVFKRKPSQRARELVRSGLQVRIFSLPEGAAKPVAITTSDDCEVYLSVVHPLDPTENTDIPFRKMDHSWLTLSYSLNSIKDGRYFLVFEQAGPIAPQFRIKKGADATKYFATGLMIEVYDDGTVSLGEVRADYLKRRASLGELYNEIDSNAGGIPCYGYRSLQADTSDEPLIAQAALERCQWPLDDKAAM